MRGWLRISPADEELGLDTSAHGGPAYPELQQMQGSLAKMPSHDAIEGTKTNIFLLSDGCLLTPLLTDCGVALAACSEKASRDVAETDLTQPVALIVGNEGTGVRRELQGAVNVSIRIPMHGSIGSLNAMVAASVTLYEARRQRRLKS